MKTDKKFVGPITDNDKNGRVRFKIPNQDDVDVGVVLTKLDGRDFVIKLSQLGIGRLAGLEPFNLPGFAAVNPVADLVSLYDTEAFLAEMLTF